LNVGVNPVTVAGVVFSVVPQFEVRPVSVLAVGVWLKFIIAAALAVPLPELSPTTLKVGAVVVLVPIWKTTK